ncbi:MAG: response regulator [Planctomycetota bacterium]
MARYTAQFRKNDNNEGRRNSLGLDADRLDRLLDILDGNTEESSNLKRTHVRWPFRSDSVPFRLIEGFGGRREFKVAARNLSNSGLSVIHNAYVHPGVDCEVVLPTSETAAAFGGDGNPRTIAAVVKRCQHVQGVVHEVGIAFKESVDARQFLKLDSISAYYSMESIKPEEMEGSILHIEDSALDRRLLAHYLDETRIIIHSADSLADAREKAKDSYDLIVLDMTLGDGHGLDLCEWMQENGILTPVVVLTADTSRELEDRCQDIQIGGFLRKPVDPGTLLRTVSEFLVSGSDQLRGTTDDSLQGLTSEFVNELSGVIDDLRGCMEREDAMAAYSIVTRVKGTAPALGFDRLANVADRLASALAASMSCAESSRQIDAMLDACERIRHRRAG